MNWLNSMYGSSALHEALQASSGLNKSLANEAILNAYASGGIEGIKSLARANGLEPLYVAGNNAYPIGWTDRVTYAVKEVPNLSPTLQRAYTPIPLQNSIEVLETGDKIVKYNSLPAKVTKAGTTIESGGIMSLAPAVAFAGAVATGVGLGYKSYKEHPDFWTDFSNSIFNSELGDSVPVLTRLVSGKYTTYAKESHIVALTKELADRNAFGSYEYTSTIPSDFESGLIDTTFTNINVVPNRAVQECINKKINDYPDLKIYSVQYADSNYLPDGNIEGGAIILSEPLEPSKRNVESYIDATGTTIHRVKLNSCIGIVTYIRSDNSVYTVVHDNTSEYIPSGYEHTGNGQDKSYVIGGLNVNEKYESGKIAIFPEIPDVDNIGLSSGLPLSDVQSALRSKYTDWYNNSFELPVYNPSTDSIEEDVYYPLSLPINNPFNDDMPESGYDLDYVHGGELNPTQQQQYDNTTTDTPVLDTINPTPTIPTEPTPPDNPLIVGGTGTDLFAVYNPTKNEIASLGQYLWSSNIVEILQKFLNNPMEAIISLHMIYCSPINGARKNIVLGYLDSGVSALTVAEQFVNINCGSVDVKEYFNDARDYSPYTSVEAYLPFIGMVKLKTEDIIGSKVTIKYTADVLTGAILCKIFVTKSGTEQQLYAYSGNCSVQIPLTGADRTRLISGAVTGVLAGGIAGGVAGAVVGGLAKGYMSGSSIERSGGFTSNSGAMGIKTPYIIVSRKYGYDALDYNKFYGFPSNKTITLGSCKGFTKVKETHVENVARATDKEKTEIENLLKNGVIV